MECHDVFTFSPIRWTLHLRKLMYHLENESNTVQYDLFEDELIILPPFSIPACSKLLKWQLIYTFTVGLTKFVMCCHGYCNPSYKMSKCISQNRVVRNSGISNDRTKGHRVSINLKIGKQLRRYIIHV